MRLVDVLLSFPLLLLLLLLAALFARQTATFNFFGQQIDQSVVAMVALIGVTGWTGLARIVRSLVLTLREREFVLAARMVGASDLRIIFIHILPSCIGPIVVTATLGVGGAIITEAYLSFLGFGVRPPTPTWGNIIEAARGRFNESWWLWVFPSIMLMITSLGINFLGDGLRDALDPRSVK
jgi:peptide/nickel transport system permease protein